jgi:hypothetical protein
MKFSPVDIITIWEEHRLRIFGNEGEYLDIREKVMGGWRKLYEKLHKFFTIHEIILGDHIKGDEMAMACSMHGRHEKCL